MFLVTEYQNKEAKMDASKMNKEFKFKIGDSNNPFSAIDRTNRKIRKSLDLNITHQVVLLDIYRTTHPTKAEHSFQRHIEHSSR